MATNSGLGLIQRLPREIRDSIYELLIPWTSCTYLDDEYTISRTKRNTCNMLLVSHSLFTELYDTMFTGWTLTFNNLLEATPFLECHDHQNCITAVISHPKMGTMTLPPLGRCEMMPRFLPYHKKKPTFFPFYEKAPHQLWKAVNVKIQAPDPLDPGQLIMYWRGINLIIELFKLRCPKTLNIVFEGQWDKGGKMTTSIPELAENGRVGDLGLLMKPLGCLFSEHRGGPQITLKRSSAPQGITWRSKWKTSAENIKNTEAPLLIEDYPARSQHNSSHCEYVLDGIHTQGRVDAMLDYYLDELPGKTAWSIRLCRWIRWSGEYERKATGNIGLLADGRREVLFSALAERWAVWKRTDWCASRILNDPEIELSERLPGRFFYDKLCYATEDMFYRNPQRGDKSWNKRKYNGLFYDRNILVTPQGMRWESLHWSEWDDEDVLYRLTTPARRRLDF